MSKIVVTVKALIPVIQYGNIAIEATMEIDPIDLDDENEGTIPEHITHVRKELARSIIPLVEAEITRNAESLLNQPNPDNWMRRNSTVYQWFRISNPDVEIPAMAAILASKDVPNRINGGLDMNTPKGKLQGHGKYTQEFEQSDRFPGMADGLPGE